MVRLHHLFPFFLLGVDGQDSSSASTDCQSRINHHRAKYGISPLITERSELHSCVNRQSEYDKQMGAHKSYKRCGSLGSQGQVSVITSFEILLESNVILVTHLYHFCTNQLGRRVKLRQCYRCIFQRALALLRNRGFWHTLRHLQPERL